MSRFDTHHELMIRYYCNTPIEIL